MVGAQLLASSSVNHLRHQPLQSKWERTGMRSYLKVAEVCYHFLDSCRGVLHKLLYSFWVILLQVSLDTGHKNRTVNCLVCIYTITGKKIF